jgi:hypothetical protein
VLKRLGRCVLVGVVTLLIQAPAIAGLSHSTSPIGPEKLMFVTISVTFITGLAIAIVSEFCLPNQTDKPNAMVPPPGVV